MIRKIVTLILITTSAFSGYALDWQGAKWIWQQEDGPSNSWMSFRKTLELNTIPEEAIAHISVDSKFWLWVNGEMVIFEGGLARGPSQAGDWDRLNKITPSNSWYENIDIQPYLKQGENTIALLVWYWGRETHKGTHIDSKKGGLLFYCDAGDKTLVSDDTWKMIKHPGYDENNCETSKSLVQFKVKYDARTHMNDWSKNAWYTEGFSDESWMPAVEKGSAGSAPWYNLFENYVPRLVNHGLKEYKSNADLQFPFVSKGTTIICQLPFNMQVTPYFEIEAEPGKVINVTTDNRLNKISANYTTKSGDQSFECFSWMNGHTINYEIPAGIKVKALKYRWMSVGEMAGSFEASDPFYERLWWMGRNTLFVCARDNFMDCPDRERALWIGDVADQTGYIFYSMDNAGRELLKKAILTTINFSEDKVIGALGPLRVRELPGQSLQFIAQTIWPYYFNTGDKATLAEAYPFVFDYLALFEMQANGLPEYRKGASPDSWDWNDWGVKGTIDSEPIQTALYYMALARAKLMAETLGESAHIPWYESRMNSIKRTFNKVYWKEGYYSSNVNEFKDDRANALAILSGLADSSKSGQIVTNVLVPNHYCSPHFEWMVNEAMCMAGKYPESLARMKERYQSQVDNVEITTLYENFPKGGSYNHAWNAPNTVLSRYIAGIAPTKVGWSEYQILPNLGHLTSLNEVVPSVKGDIEVSITQKSEKYLLDLISPEGTVAIVGIPKFGGYVSKIAVNDKVVWKKGTFMGSMDEILWNEEDSKYIKFNVLPGTWRFSAY